MTKYCIFQYKRSKESDMVQRVKRAVIDLEATLLRIPYDNSEVYDILKAKAFCVIWEDYMRRSKNQGVPKHHAKYYGYLRWAYDIFAKHKMHRMIVWCSEKLVKEPKLNRIEKRAMIRKSLKCARLIRMQEKIAFFERQEQEMEIESESLDSKRIVFMNSYITDTNPPYVAYMMFNKEMRKYMLDDLKKYEKDLLVHFTEFSAKNLMTLVENSKGCRLCVIDVPIYGHGDPLNASGPTIDSRSGSVYESTVSYSTFKPDQIGQIDVLLVLGTIQDPEARKLIEKIPVQYLVTLSFAEIVKNPLDIFNIVMSSEFKYIFLQRFCKLLITGNKVETALEQIRQVTVEELRKIFKKHTLQSITNQNGEMVSEPIEMDPNLFFKDCIKVTRKSDNLKLRFEFKKGSIEETPSVYSQSQLFHKKSEPIMRPDTIRRIIEAMQKYQLVNLYGKHGLGKTLVAKMLFNQCTVMETFKDGVYFFDLKLYAEEHPNGNIKDLMKTKLGESFDENMDAYFKNREMLIIFDDFHVITTNNQLIFPIHLIKMLAKHNISVVLTSDKKLRGEDHIKKMKYIKLNRLTAEESLMLFLYSQNHLLVKLDSQSLYQALKSDIIRKCKGFPKLIIQNAHRFTSKVLGLPPPNLDRSEVVEISESDNDSDYVCGEKKKNHVKAHSEFNVIEESPSNILAALPPQDFGRFTKVKPENRKANRWKQVGWKRDSRGDKF